MYTLYTKIYLIIQFPGNFKGCIEDLFNQLIANLGEMNEVKKEPYTE